MSQWVLSGGSVGSLGLVGVWSGGSYSASPGGAIIMYAASLGEFVLSLDSHRLAALAWEWSLAATKYLRAKVE